MNPGSEFFVEYREAGKLWPYGFLQWLLRFDFQDLQKYIPEKLCVFYSLVIGQY